jgi:hypothetical protein
LQIGRGWNRPGCSRCSQRAGDENAKECLYPDEDRTLLACVDVALLRRMAYGFLTPEGMRTDELARPSRGATSTSCTTASTSTRECLYPDEDRTLLACVDVALRQLAAELVVLADRIDAGAPAATKARP